MLSDVQKRKMVHLFRCYDLNGKGHVELRDFERIARNLARACGYGEDSHETETLLGQYTDLFMLIVSTHDANNDLKIHLDEWLAGRERMLSRRADAEQFFKMLGDVIFDTFDHNRDGTISFEEYTRLLTAHGVDLGADAPAVKSRVFRGKDGLSRDDCHDLILEFEYSSDEAAPGHWLMGVL